MSEYADFEIDNGIADWGEEEFNGEEYISSEEAEEKFNTEKPCEHLDYVKKRVMDFDFYVCERCGFQWKA